MLINSWKFQEVLIKKMSLIPESHRGSVAWIIMSTLQEMYEGKEKKKAQTK